MVWNNALTELLDSLILLYPDEDVARRVVTQAQVAAGNINFQGGAKQFWSSILVEAEKQNKVSALIDVAMSEYGENTALLTAAANYRAAPPATLAADAGAQPQPAPARPAARTVPSPLLWAAGAVTLAMLLALVVRNLAPTWFGTEPDPTPTAPATATTTATVAPSPTPTTTATPLPDRALQVRSLVDKPTVSSADVDIIATYLLDGSVPENDKWEIITNLGKPGWRNAKSLLLEIVNTTNDTTSKIQAVAALGRIGVAARSELLELLGSPDSIVRNETIKALTNLPPAMIPITEIRAVLRNDPDPLVQKVALEVLGELNAFKAVGDMIFLLRGGAEIVRTQAAQTLVIFDTVAEVRPALRRTAAEDPAVDPRRYAISSLFLLQDRESVALFQKLSNDPDLTIRAVASDAYFRSQSWAEAGDADETPVTPVATSTATPTPTPAIALEPGAQGVSHDTLLVYAAPGMNQVEAEFDAGSAVTLKYVVQSSDGAWAFVLLPDESDGWVSVSAIDWQRPAEPAASASPQGKLWANGRTIKVAFLDGDPQVQAKVMRYAQEWSKYANIHFDFVEKSNDAEIRIAFGSSGSWSYLGVDALSVAADQPTMNFGWLTPSTEETEVRRVVLAMFGHALGLQLEHRNPNATIPWDREKAYAYYEGTLNWSKQQVDDYLFTQWDRNLLPIDKEFDPKSIMMLLPISEDLTFGSYSIGANTELSAYDKKFIALLYPYPEPVATATPMVELVDDLGRDDPIRRLASAVGELDIVSATGRRAPLCTAFVISPDYILTADYCAASSAGEPGTLVLRMGFLSSGAGTRDFVVDSEPVELSEELGYAILAVADDPAALYGMIPLSPTHTPQLGEALVMLYHSDGHPMVAVRQNCAVSEAEAPIVSGTMTTSAIFAHTCGGGGGSAGGPILAAADNSLLGWHYAGNQDRTWGKRLDVVIAQSAIMRGLTK